MPTMWKLGGLSWKDLAGRVWSEVQKDEVFGRAAQLSYYFLLALFPLLIFLTSFIGFVVGSGTGMRHSLFNYLAQVMPASAFVLVDTTISEITNASGGGKISFGILAALWAASSGMGAITQALNVAYDVSETRPWWKQKVVAVGLTVALALLIITALALVLYGGHIADGLAGHFGFGGVFTLTWKILQVAGPPGVHADRLRTDLLLGAGPARPGLEVGNAGCCDRSYDLADYLVRLPDLPSLF